MADAAVPANKVWAIKIGNTLTQLQDLPGNDIERIARHHGLIGAALVDAPVGCLGAAADLVELVATKRGLPVPFEPHGDTYRELAPIFNEFFEYVDDDFPTSWDDQEEGPSVPPEADQEIKS